MKATLTFNLPEEREEFELANNGAKLASRVDEFKNWLRGELKYNDKLTENEHEIIDVIREKFYECLNDE